MRAGLPSTCLVQILRPSRLYRLYRLYRPCPPMPSEYGTSWSVERCGQSAGREPGDKAKAADECFDFLYRAVGSTHIVQVLNFFL